MIKNELKKVKARIINKTLKKQELEKEKNKISEEIEVLNEKHLKFLDYNRYQNNSHIAVGTVAFIGMNYFSIKMLNQPITNSVLISLLPTLLASETTRFFFFKKRKKIEQANPKIDFKNYDVEATYEKLFQLHNEKMALLDEITLINNECDKYYECCEELLEENINNNKIINKDKEYTKENESYVKVKVMTLTRKK